MEPEIYSLLDDLGLDRHEWFWTSEQHNVWVAVLRDESLRVFHEGGPTHFIPPKREEGLQFIKSLIS
jgi:hypothetical protein